MKLKPVKRRCVGRPGTALIHRVLAFGTIATLALATLVSTPGLAEQVTLVRVGPRIGFSGQTFLGKQQKHHFVLYDVAAFFSLPWQWRIGDSGWKLGTTLITSAGLLTAADDAGFMATVVPGLALSTPNGRVSLDAGFGPGFFSNYTFGIQDFGGPVQIVATIGVGLNLFSHAYAGFRLQHFSDAHLYGSGLGVDLYIAELAYRF